MERAVLLKGMFSAEPFALESEALEQANRTVVIGDCHRFDPVESHLSPPEPQTNPTPTTS